MGLAFDPEVWPRDWDLSAQIGWQSNGGPHRGHPARSLPSKLEVDLTLDRARIGRVHLLGIFGLYAKPEFELVGTQGASLLIYGPHELEFSQVLVNGRHYFDASQSLECMVSAGDGTSLETAGSIRSNDELLRVDVLSVDLPPGTTAHKIIFRDLGTPASFVIFDIFVEVAAGSGCPFHEGSGGVALADLPSIVRLGDRVRLNAALQQLEASLPLAEDLDEARGQALTFLAMITAASLEMGGSRSMHRVQLDAARELEGINSPAGIVEATRRWVEFVGAGFFKEAMGPSAKLVDRALQFVDRNYAKDLTDSGVAAQLGLSTSHFRYLFRQATGQPFHKYLIAIRLEKAKAMLLEQESSVGLVARSVGFAGLSNFSRAFTQRFRISPTSIRKIQ